MKLLVIGAAILCLSWGSAAMMLLFDHRIAAFIAVLGLSIGLIFIGIGLMLSALREDL